MQIVKKYKQNANFHSGFDRNFFGSEINMFEKSAHKGNKTESDVIQTVRRRPVLSNCHVSQYRRQCNSPTPITKAQTSLRGFSLNTQMFSIIMCRSLITIFTDIGWHMSTVLTAIHSCPKTKVWCPLCLLSQNWQPTEIVLSTSPVLNFTHIGRRGRNYWHNFTYDPK